MKYIVLVADGMADYPIKELGGRSPLEVARTPNMDFIAQHGIMGQVKTIPQRMPPASDVANISILGYDPLMYYTGRGPLEAANLGVDLGDNDVAFRCNLVTVSGDKLLDYSAGHIGSKEAAELMKFIDRNLGNDRFKFYSGVSYRNLMLVKDGAEEGLQDLGCKPPHDIMGQGIDKNLPQGKNAQMVIKLMLDSRQILENQEINLVRIDLKENPANMIWLWGQGRKPSMPKFFDKYGLSGSIISAVDLIKGLGKILGLDVINVPGATGYYDTDYKGKAKAALESLAEKDFVLVHVEAPDEASHNGDLRQKILAIERFDQLVVGTILKAFKNRRKDFRILALPDHATPLSLRTHAQDAVCFGILGKDIAGKGFLNYSEKEAKKSDLYFEKGHELLDYFIKQPQGHPSSQS
ncbi:MAG: cofactor-independent phosphoglycerate mutase [Candidatus Omnitrophica bacterium]|nr:cofactor-independent phosphoglycerate mutase [Candidatus Omnitrophota bacterium]MBU4472562.1 cofactor-independent phosphoglycerate mutase [Candidatus Omnitrophota bacterium]MCG2706833.1 cofactor-independent phosphoglycerate mutase [Candidatus Omnitrophota bacterium]